MGHNGEAALRVCVPTNEVSDLIFLLGAILFYIQRNKNVKRQDKYIYYYWSSYKPPYS